MRLCASYEIVVPARLHYKLYKQNNNSLCTRFRCCCCCCIIFALVSAHIYIFCVCIVNTIHEIYIAFCYVLNLVLVYAQRTAHTAHCAHSEHTLRDLTFHWVSLHATPLLIFPIRFHFCICIWNYSARPDPTSNATQPMHSGSGSLVTLLILRFSSEKKRTQFHASMGYL